MKPEVADAIEEIKSGWRGSTVVVSEDGSGGAFVIVEGVSPGEQYAQAETWIGFQITFNYPYSDVYPHFVRGDLSRKDGAVLGEAMSSTSFEGRPAIQISRKSKNLNAVTDTAAIKLAKVLTWLRSR